MLLDISMEISKASAAAIHGLTYLAGVPGRAPVDVKEIAKELDIAEGYLAKTFQQLSRSRLVLSRRGPSGGYVLAREPERITLLQIIEAIEGPVLTRACEFYPDEHCRLFDRCKIREQLESLREQTRKLYESVTLDAFDEQFSET